MVVLLKVYIDSDEFPLDHKVYGFQFHRNLPLNYNSVKSEEVLVLF